MTGPVNYPSMLDEPRPWHSQGVPLHFGPIRVGNVVVSLADTRGGDLLNSQTLHLMASPLDRVLVFVLMSISMLIPIISIPGGWHIFRSIISIPGGWRMFRPGCVRVLWQSRM